MMDLRVWVTEHGAPQVVHNVTDHTTCREVIHALAQATARTGRFVLTLRQGCNERSLAPGEKPAQFIHHLTQNASSSSDNNIKLILYHLADDTVTRRGSSVHSAGLESAETFAQSVSVPPTKGNFAGGNSFIRGMYEKGEPSKAENDSTAGSSLSWLHAGRLSPYPSTSREWSKLSNSSLASQTVRHPPPSYEETMQSRCKHATVGSLKNSPSSVKPAQMSSSQSDSVSRQSWPPVSTAAELARFICGQNTVLSEQQDIMQSLDREIIRWLQRKEVQSGESDLECQIAEHENQLKNVLGNIESLKKMNLERQIAAIRRNLEKTSCEIRANTTECQKLDRRLAERNHEIKRLRAEIEAEKLYISSRLNASDDSCDLNVSDLEDQVEAAEETRKAKLAICQQLRRQLTNANMESLEECLDGLKLLQNQPARRHDSTDTGNSNGTEVISNAQELPLSKNASVWV